jgi:hypothetical protein
MRRPKAKGNSESGAPLFHENPALHSDRVEAFRIFFHDVVGPNNEKLISRSGRYDTMGKLVNAKPHHNIPEGRLRSALWALYQAGHFRSDTEWFRAYPPYPQVQSAQPRPSSISQPMLGVAQQSGQVLVTSAAYLPVDTVSSGTSAVTPVVNPVNSVVHLQILPRGRLPYLIQHQICKVTQKILEYVIFCFAQKYMPEVLEMCQIEHPDLCE